MDVLRSGYSTRMRFDPSSPGRSSPVTWYRCPAGAQVFPGAHNFPSLNWYRGSNLPQAPLGELLSAPRPWSNGKTPVEATGTKLCVVPAAFMTGLPYLSTPRDEYPDSYPKCCNLIPTACCGFMPAQMMVTLISETDPLSPWFPYIGVSWVLNWNGIAKWFFNIAPGPPALIANLIVLCAGLTSLQLQMEATGTIFTDNVFYNLPDCIQAPRTNTVSTRTWKVERV